LETNELMIQSLPDIFPKIKNAYIVGGSVRDVLRGQSPTDYDIAVFTDPGKFAEMITASQKGRIVEIGKPGKMVTRVILKEFIVDIVSGAGSNIHEDLKKRDFTINAMACDLSTGEVIDCVDGMKDLKNKTIRMVSEDAFIKDPVRMVRAFRLGASLGFEIESLTASAIKNNTKHIKHSAGERIRSELLKILRTSNASTFISKMADARLLFEIIPELTALKECRQNNHHQYDVFDHTMKALQYLEAIIDENTHFMPENRDLLDPFINSKKGALLKFAILLHDIGKPTAKTKDEKSRIKFHGHESISADMAASICRRLRFSSYETEYVNFIIKSHLWPLSLYISSQNKTLKNKWINRFFMKCKDNTLDLLLHAIADFKGKDSDNSEKSRIFEAFAKDIIQSFFMEFMPKTQKPPLITGDDLVKELGLTPSPVFKTLLDKAEEARISNEINTKEEALHLVKTLLENRDHLQ